MSLVRNTSITVTGRFATAGAAALAAVVVGRALGAEGMGTLTKVGALPRLIAALLGAGITIANAYMIGGRKHSTQRITETTTFIGLVLSLVGLGAWFLAGSLLHANVYSQLTPTVALIVGLAIPLNILRDFLNSVQQGMQNFVEANVVMALDDVVSLLVVLPLLAGVGGTNLVVASVLIGPALALLLAVALLVRRGIRPIPRLHGEIAREAIIFGFKGHPGRIANLLSWRLDVAVLSFLASNQIVGYYGVASKVAEAFRPLSQSLTFVLRPLIASLPAREAHARGVHLYRRVFAINLGLAVVMAIVGGPLIVYCFGSEFSAAVPAFQILLIGLTAHGADGVVNGFNIGIGRPEFNTYAAFVGMAVTIVLDIALIPSYSLIGAAIASSVAYTAKAVAMTVLFLSSTGTTFPQLIGLKEYSPDVVQPTA